MHQLTKNGVGNKLFNFLHLQTDFEHVRELAAFELNLKRHMAMQNKKFRVELKYLDCDAVLENCETCNCTSNDLEMTFANGD